MLYFAVPLPWPGPDHRYRGPAVLNHQVLQHQIPTNKWNNHCGVSYNLSSLHLRPGLHNQQHFVVVIIAHLSSLPQTAESLTLRHCTVSGMRRNTEDVRFRKHSDEGKSWLTTRKAAKNIRAYTKAGIIQFAALFCFSAVSPNCSW